MKKYKLKKDLPTVRAGEVFVRKTNETMQVDMLHRVDSEDVFLPPSIEVDDIHNFDEWFEEVKEFEEWKPYKGDEYKCAGSAGIPYEATYFDDDVDRYRLSIGNCYPLDTPYKTIIKEQKLIPQAMHRLKMTAKKAWFEFDGSEDWDMEFDAYYIASDLDDSSVRVCTSYDVRAVGVVYFPTEKSCQAYIDNNPEDIKLLFGVE